MKKKIFKTLTFIGIATLFVTTVSAIDNSLELKKDISFLESKIEINYKENLGTENGSLLVYSDKEKNEFIYKDGDLVAYIANDSILSTTQKNSLDNKIDVNKKLIELETKASNYAKQLINAKKTSFDSYVLYDSAYLEATGEYSYTYLKMFDGILVNDGIMISINADGELITFSGAFQGKFDNYKNLKVDTVAVEKFIKDEMTKYFGTDKKCEYSVDKQYINYVNDELVLQIGINIIHEDGLQSTEVLNYKL
ncbi:MAG: hypothetical protein IJO27_01260 [Bacilli bacterium]|nr:hypothetical protein [Bacilli bacterium]MBQ7030843.1 hypothetical protein [Bacilli bacterium]